MTPTALLVDARPVGHPTAKQRGIGRYVTGFLRGLTDIGAPLTALYGDESEAETLRRSIPDLPMRRWSRDAVRDHAEPGVWYVATQLMLHPIPLDPVPRVVTEAHLPVAAVMYDVIPYRFADRYHVAPDARFQAELRAPLTRTLDSLLAISRFAADTAAIELNYPRDRIGVIGAGVEPEFVPNRGARGPLVARVIPPHVHRYVVAVTGVDERKNTEGLIRAWALVLPGLREGRHLVIACSHSPGVLAHWMATAEKAGVADRVVFTGALEDDEMVAVVQSAELSVMPSFEEGFGLPVLEAAACGVPAISSNLTSLPEVLDEPSACFDPHDDRSIADAIDRALGDEGHRTRLLEAGGRAARRWTWQRVAQDTMEVLGAHGPRWTTEPRRPTIRLALGGPFSGSQSGVAHYDERVLSSLRRASMDSDRSVVALVDSTASIEPTRWSATDERLPIRAIGRFAKPWDFDDIVLALGSSPHHAGAARLAAEVPCHLWFHEATLVGLHVGVAHSSGSESWARSYVRSVLDRDEDGFGVSLMDHELLDAEFLHGSGVTLLSDVLAMAKSVIVSSQRGADIVRSVRPNGPPLLVLPLAYPPPIAPSGPPRSLQIVSAGWLADNKAPRLALEVLHRLGGTGDVSLVFVGAAQPNAIEAARAIAADLGVETLVSFTGRLDDESYAQHVSQSRVGLQLREHDRGEMSAAINDLVARGVPTVTTLQTAGPTSSGLRLVEPSVAAIVEAIRPLLIDDDEWRNASADAIDRAMRWSFDDVSGALLGWLRDVPRLPGPTVRRISAPLAS